jgi:AcrR family transcriptional regulator
MGSVSQTPRLYRGISPTERRARRRARLLEAGLELFGTDGYADSSVRAVCAEASLNSRYFYESFTDREDLLYHVYKGAVSAIAENVLEATGRESTIEGQARSGLRAAWRTVADDPRRAKVIGIEVVGVSGRLERLRRENRHAFAEILMQNAQMVTSGAVELRMDPLLTARSLMGAFVDLQVDWINGDVDASIEELVEHFTKLFTAVAYAAVRDPAGPAPPRRRSAHSEPARQRR